MKVYQIGNHAVSKDHADILLKKYDEKESYHGYKWQGLIKADTKNIKTIPAPVNMKMLLNLAEEDDYHGSCVSAVAESAIVDIDSKDSNAKSLLDNLELADGDNMASLLTDFLRDYQACGNGFLLKLRNIKGEWVGLSRLNPGEMQIIEKYDDFGFFAPDFIQSKNSKRKIFAGKDIIHFKKTTNKSLAWGLSSLPVLLNCEILKEIKSFNYNNFKNGLLIDYFIIVEGGGLGEKYTDIDSNGNEINVDPFDDVLTALQGAKGVKNSHGAILLESPEAGSKIRLEPLRHDKNDFIELKNDLREGIFVYHRVPRRLVGIETSGKLGGDNTSDMSIFYQMVVKPIQTRLYHVLSRQMKMEFGWNVKPKSFDFGNISDVLETIETKISRGK